MNSTHSSPIPENWDQSCPKKKTWWKFWGTPLYIYIFLNLPYTRKQRIKCCLTSISLLVKASVRQYYYEMKVSVLCSLFHRDLCLLFLLWESRGLWKYSSQSTLLLGTHPGESGAPFHWKNMLSNQKHNSWCISLYFSAACSSALCFCDTGVLNRSCLPHQTVVIGSYLIAHGFFSVYAMCVDTLFLCFCK